MQVLEYSVLAVSSLFVIVDPIAIVPTFLAMTPDGTPRERIRIVDSAALRRQAEGL